jgi:galactonate dehydratase
MDTRAIATPIVDVTWGGGITFGRRCAALAETRGLPIAFHDCSGPITLAASTHLALAVPNVREQEIARGMYYGWYAELVDQPAPVTNGMITVPAGPGLGVGLQPGLEKRKDAVVRRTSFTRSAGAA